MRKENTHRRPRRNQKHLGPCSAHVRTLTLPEGRRNVTDGTQGDLGSGLGVDGGSEEEERGWRWKGAARR